MLPGDADSGIAKFDPDLRGVVSLGANPELSAPGHGLNGVGDQVQKHLPQGILVGKTRPHLAPRGLDGDLMVGQVFLHQLERLAQQIVQINRLQLGAAVARKLQQVGDDFLGAGDFFLGNLEVFADFGLVGIDNLAQIVDRVQDNAQRIPNLVRDPGRQLTDRRHLFRLDELALQPFMGFLLVAQGFLVGLNKKIGDMQDALGEFLVQQAGQLGQAFAVRGIGRLQAFEQQQPDLHLPG